MRGTNLIVFRDDAKQVGRHEFTRNLEAAFWNLRNRDSGGVLDALVLAGQLESSLWDCGSPIASRSSAVTDAFARCLVEGSWAESSCYPSIWDEVLVSLPQQVRLSEPEGFAYYALHPEDFADGVASFADSGPVALIGIRSIGTTLSAVAMARLRKAKTPVSRITVRPTGHPYNRKTHFTSSEVEWVTQNNRDGSTFLVLDEGPGLSGSSFLSVSESLVNCGVAPDRITMIGTHECQPDQLCANDAVHRWGRFGWRKVGSRIATRFSSSVFLAGGNWRQHFLRSESEWPECWKEMESLRFLTSGKRRIVKFEGFGRAGESTLERAQLVHESGFGPGVEDIGNGMHSYTFVQGRPLLRQDVTSGVVDQIAKYCVCREREFGRASDEGRHLREMVEFNFSQVTGASIDLPEDCFATSNAVVVDGRMQPHEWIRSISGQLLKVDAVRHGDDHCLPGPTDIAWDLAGAIVEWDLSENSSEYLLNKFHTYSGMRASERLSYFILAYSTFRHSYCEMAAQASQDATERARLQRSSAFYRHKMDEIAHSEFNYLTP